MKKVISWALCILWMGVIFGMSAMPGDVSGEQSGTVTKIVLSVVSFCFGEQAAGAVPVDTLEFLVRKAAHMTEYAILFGLYCHALRVSGVKRAALTALLMSAAYAASDEFHQSFTDGRGSSPIDVCIDTAGAGIALLLRAVFLRVDAVRRSKVLTRFGKGQSAQDA